MGVPQSGEHAAWPEHPRDLRQGAAQIEPVRGLSGQHRVDRCVGQRDILGAADQGRNAGQQQAEFGEHSRIGFDGDDGDLLGADREASQLGGELAGAGAQVKRLDRPAWLGHRFERPPYRRDGIVGPVLGVNGRRGSERGGALGVFTGGRVCLGCFAIDGLVGFLHAVHSSAKLTPPALAPRSRLPDRLPSHGLATGLVTAGFDGANRRG